jgi:hypothetical protein
MYDGENENGTAKLPKHGSALYRWKKKNFCTDEKRTP